MFKYRSITLVTDLLKNNSHQSYESNGENSKRLTEGGDHCIRYFKCIQVLKYLMDK